MVAYCVKHSTRYALDHLYNTEASRKYPFPYDSHIDAADAGITFVPRKVTVSSRHGNRTPVSEDFLP